MTRSTDKIRFWCELALALLTVAVAVLFISQAADIYYSAKQGEQIYTRAVVGHKLVILIAPMVLWFVAAVACFVLSVVYPQNAKPHKPGRANVVRNLVKKLPKSSDKPGFNEKRKTVSGFEAGRYIIYGAATAFSVASAIIAIVYLAQASHFASNNINDGILGLVKNVFPFIIASFVLFIAAAVYEYATAKAELNSIKTLLVLCKGEPISRSPLALKIDAVKAAAERYGERIVLGMRIAVLAVAAVFLGLGIANSGAGDVLQKAINICTECIGLG